MTVAEIPQSRSPKLTLTRFFEAEMKRRIWVAIAEPGITPDDVLAPSYWAHCSAKFTPLDRVEVYAEDGSWFSELMVQYASRVDAKLVRLRNVELAPVLAPEKAADFIVKWAGPHAKFRVLRVKDNVKMAEEFATPEAAQDWIVQHRKTLAA